MWLLAFALSAQANDGPTPAIFAEQIGTDVQLTLRLHDNGEPGIGSDLDLFRDETELLTAHRFSPDEAVETDWYCSGGDAILYGPLDHMIDCELEPEYCELCGDSDVSCPFGGCYQSYDIVVTDACVAEGSHTWKLRETGAGWWPASVELTVEPSDQECALDPEAGCSGCQSATAPGYALGALMLALGLLLRPRRA